MEKRVTISSADSSQTAQVLLHVLRFLLLLSPWCLLLVSDALLFPYVSAKVFAFRLLVEISLALWVILVMSGNIALHALRQPLSLAIFAFVIWVLISNQLGINPTQSFWSSYERADGGLQMLHYLAWYVMLCTALSQRHWRAQIGSTLLAMTAIALFALFNDSPGTRKHGLLGNPIYFGNAMVFALFLLGIWLSALASSRIRFLLFPLLAALFLWGIMASASRSSIFALLAGIGLSLYLWCMFKYPDRRQRIITSLSVLAALFILGTGLTHYRSQFNDWAEEHNHYVLKRLSNISGNDQTTADRIANWHIALDASKESPVHGWGQENYLTAFLEHYRPGVLDEADLWFDRAHNAYLDWLVSNGSLGLILYLIILGAAYWQLWARSTCRRNQQILVSGLLTAYMAKNMVGFDVLTSYFILFSILAFITYHAKTTQNIALTSFRTPHWLVGISVSLLSFPILYSSILKPLQANHALLLANQFQQIANHSLPHCPHSNATDNWLVAHYCQAWETHQYQPDKRYVPAYMQMQKTFRLAPQYSAEQFAFLSKNVSMLTSNPDIHNQQQTYTLLANQYENRLYHNARDWQTQYNNAIVSAKTRQYDRAINLLNNLLQNVPQKPAFWLALSKTHWHHQQPARAIIAYHSARTLNAGYSELGEIENILPLQIFTSRLPKTTVD